jgi:aspartyl-tRNA(Asn)/glutamyl-tRNA(Gln) amidotransferase subunit A
MMLQVMAGADPNDSTAVSEPVPDYVKMLSGGVKRLRIGVPTDSFYDHINPETLKAVHACIGKLKDMGASIVDVKVPHADLAGPALWIIAMAEGAAYHEKRLKDTPELFDPVVRERLEAATFYPAVDYIKAQRIRTLLMNDMHQVFEKCDVMSVPAGNPATKLEPPETAKSDIKPGSHSEPRRGSTNIGDMTGMPGLVIPCGFTAGTPTLPLGIQFYGRPFEESTLYRVAHAYEFETDWHKRRAPLAT